LDQLSPRLKQHLFEGHYMSRTNRDVGYHHREGGVDLGAVRVVRVVAGPSGNGVYRAEIRGPRTEGSPVVKRSTFFPDSWTRGQVLCAIRHAFANRYEYDRAKRRWRGVYNGMHIEGYVEGRLADPRTGPEHPRLYHIKTAYPMRRQAP
ncbi:EndoU domain-containing protein, partial [Actinophytocola sp.]|uniref:EndoU domain-containing protein n=1 Tax=Actinophytocola sp. TaxID=1872138 RepID=UPI002ED969CC